MTTDVSAVRRSRLAAGWRAAHHPVPDAPHWAVVAAWLVPLVVLPSSIWRITVVWFAPPEGGGRDDLPAWLPIELWVVVLSIGSELLASLAFGLVARWGEIFPRWVPGLGGRRVPTPVAVVPAALGAALLTVVTTTGAVMNAQGLNVRGEPLPDDYPLHLRDLEGLVSVAAYAPLVLWGPLLAVLTLAYCRRRHLTARRTRTRTPR
jgi:hypothetical protein